MPAAANASDKLNFAGKITRKNTRCLNKTVM
jgi:hypothetical protein